jgi:hypothetical protein
VAGRNERPRDRRPRQRTGSVSPTVQQRLQVDRCAGGSQSPRDLASTLDTRAALFGQELTQTRRRVGEEVREYVDVATVVDGRDLDAGHDLHADIARGRRRRRNASHRVVICDANRPQSHPLGAMHQFFRRAGAIRGSCVQMQIDHARSGSFNALFEG